MRKVIYATSEEVKKMSTDKPVTVEEIREWQNQNHRYVLRHNYDMKAIGFLLSEVDRLKAENEAMRHGPTGLGGHKCWQTIKPK